MTPAAAAASCDHQGIIAGANDKAAAAAPSAAGIGALRPHAADGDLVASLALGQDEIAACLAQPPPPFTQSAVAVLRCFPPWQPKAVIWYVLGNGSLVPTIGAAKEGRRVAELQRSRGQERQQRVRSSAEAASCFPPN